MTDLHELLTRVADEKQSELSESVQGGDAIAFDNVDIYTPADVLLVKDLSFRIQDGAAGCLNVQRTTGFHRKNDKTSHFTQTSWNRTNVADETVLNGASKQGRACCLLGTTARARVASFGASGACGASLLARSLGPLCEKRFGSSPFTPKTISLSRQARDKHRKR